MGICSRVVSRRRVQANPMTPEGINVGSLQRIADAHDPEPTPLDKIEWRPATLADIGKPVKFVTQPHNENSTWVIGILEGIEYTGEGLYHYIFRSACFGNFYAAFAPVRR